MPHQIRDFQRPPTLDRAVELLRQPDAVVVPLIGSPRMPDSGFPAVETIVDLQGLGLEAITVEGESIRIGALAPLQSLVESVPLTTAANGIVPKAAYLAAHFGLRNLATLGGAISGALEGNAGPPEILLTLLALDATTHLHGTTEPQIPLSAYRPSSSLCTAVSISTSPRPYGALARVARSPLDQAIVAAAAVVAGTTARVAVAGASAEPYVVGATTDVDATTTIARLVDAVRAAAAPRADYRGSTEYRRAMTEALARRALTEAFAHRVDS